MSQYGNYREIPRLIRGKHEFKGNSASAYYDDELGYVIKSYSTIMWCKKDGLNLKYYSMTTSRLQNIIANEYYGSDINTMRKTIEKPRQPRKPKQKSYEPINTELLMATI